jgi:peroxiredoxin
MANLIPGDQAIPFDLPGVDDKHHALADYADKEAVAVIWSCNHCPYVRAWEDRMVQIQSDYADKGVQLIAISSNDARKYPDDSFPKMKERAAQKSFNFPYLYDETQEIARAFGAERTPEVFLFDKSGTLRYHGAIDDNYDDPSAVQSQYLRKALDAVLAGQAPPTAQTPPVGCTVKWK